MAKFFNPVVDMIVGLAAQQIKDANDKGGTKMVSVGTPIEPPPEKALTVVCWGIENPTGRGIW